MSLKKGKVSIIMASFNSEKYIEQALKSVIDQTYDNWECFIIDDCSTDRSVEIIRNSIVLDNRFSLFLNSKNTGPGKARNIGITNANGQYLTFLDSDDVWEPFHLEKQISFMKLNRISISHSHYGYINSRDEKTKNIFKVSLKKIEFKNLLIRPEMSCLTTIVDISITGKYYMSSDRRRQDYYLWLGLLKAGFSSVGFDHIGGYYRQHENQPKKNLKFLFEHYYFLKLRIGLSRFDSLRYTFYYALRGFFKYLNNY